MEHSLTVQIKPLPKAQVEVRLTARVKSPSTVHGGSRHAGWLMSPWHLLAVEEEQEDASRQRGRPLWCLVQRGRGGASRAQGLPTWCPAWQQ